MQSDTREVETNPAPRQPSASSYHFVWGWAFVVVCLVVFYFRIGALTDGEMRTLFNGDTLYPAHFAKDVFKDGAAISGWLFPPAPFTFPDVVLTVLFMLVTGKGALATFLTGVVLFSLILVATLWTGRLITRTDYRAGTVVVLLVGGLSLLYFGYFPGSKAALLVLNVFHTGTYLLALVAAALTLLMLNQELTGRKLVMLLALLALCSILAASSDLLFLAYFVLPILATFVVGTFLDLLPWRRVLVLSLVVATSMVIGHKLGPVLINSADVGAASSGFSVDNFTAVTRVFVQGYANALRKGNVLHWMAFLWIGLCVAWVVGVSFYQIRRVHNKESLSLGARRLAVWMCFMGMASLACICAILFGCSNALLANEYDWACHYLCPLWLGPILGFPVLLGVLVDRVTWPTFLTHRTGMVAATLLLFIPLVCFPFGMRLRNLPHRIYPDYVAMIDRVAREHGLTNGICGYWKSREINLYSKAGLRACTVSGGGQYFDWINNHDWVGNEPRPGMAPLRMDYIVADSGDNLTREKIVARFGEPALEIPLPNDMPSYNLNADRPRVVSLLVYNRPQDEAFANYFRNDPIQLTSGSKKCSWDAVQLPFQVGKDVGTTRVADSRDTGPGYIQFGPYINLQPGTYHFALDYVAEGDTSVGAWDVCFAANGKTPFRLVDQGSLNPACTEVTTTVAVDRVSSKCPLEFRVFYSGKGKLTVKNLRLRRD